MQWCYEWFYFHMMLKIIFLRIWVVNQGVVCTDSTLNGYWCFSREIICHWYFRHVLVIEKFVIVFYSNFNVPNLSPPLTCLSLVLDYNMIFCLTYLSIAIRIPNWAADPYPRHHIIVYGHKPRMHGSVSCVSTETTNTIWHLN